TFGSGGKVITTIGSGEDIAQGVAVQSDGKIVAGGWTATNSGLNFAVVRYTTNGTLDSTFGTGGKVTTAIGAYAQGRALALQSDGKILVAGRAYNGSNDDFGAVRYNTNGSLDTTFGIG